MQTSKAFIEKINQLSGRGPRPKPITISLNYESQTLKPSHRHNKTRMIRTFEWYINCDDLRFHAML